MSSRRLLKAAEAIREVVGMAILTELKDPRVRDVTVTMVEVSADMRQARVHVSIMGEERKQQLALHGLQNSAGFLQHKISQRIDTRYTPRITFKLDKGIKNAMRVTQILKEVLPDESDQDSTEDLDSDQNPQIRNGLEQTE
jgi:ribosome-binding factor A